MSLTTLDHTERSLAVVSCCVFFSNVQFVASGWAILHVGPLLQKDNLWTVLWFVSCVALQPHVNNYNMNISEAQPTKETLNKELTQLLLLGRFNSIGDVDLLQMCLSEILTCLQPTHLHVYINIFPLWEFRSALFVKTLRIEYVDSLRRRFWNAKFPFFYWKAQMGIFVEPWMAKNPHL